MQMNQQARALTIILMESQRYIGNLKIDSTEISGVVCS